MKAEEMTNELLLNRFVKASGMHSSISPEPFRAELLRRLSAKSQPASPEAGEAEYVWTVEAHAEKTCSVQHAYRDEVEAREVFRLQPERADFCKWRKVGVGKVRGGGQTDGSQILPNMGQDCESATGAVPAESASVGAASELLDAIDNFYAESKDLPDWQRKETVGKLVGMFWPVPDTMKLRAADKIVRVIDDMVQRKLIDERSALADARLDYGEPFTYDYAPRPEPEGRFETVDLILPSICEQWPKDGVFVAIQLTDAHIEARIGGRDIRWSRETGRVTDTGFFVNPEQAEQV